MNSRAGSARVIRKLVTLDDTEMNSRAGYARVNHDLATLYEYLDGSQSRLLPEGITILPQLNHLELSYREG